MQISPLASLIETASFLISKGGFTRAQRPGGRKKADGQKMTDTAMFSTFVAPRRFRKRILDGKPRIAAIVPSFKPQELTVRLVEDLIRYNPSLTVCVVDDCTPASYEEEHRIFERIGRLGENVIVLKTAENRMKAGAINFGLSFLLGPEFGRKLDAILTLDDDVLINRQTVRRLVRNLFEDERLGAVCSQSRVLNKNRNLLTRLQGLEYLGFNAIRLADEGFFYGPLVMHGMLTAFRTDALVSAGPFAEHHLIEDYEITARLKAHGWHVRLAPAAYAWTEVPETFMHLWCQRTRWSYGGIVVVTRSHWKSVVQDFIGHGMFIATLALIAASLFLSEQGDAVPQIIPALIFSASIVQFAVWYGFQMWVLRLYPERDGFDILVRSLLLPEFIYGTVLTVTVMGAYLFHGSQFLLSLLPRTPAFLSVRSVTERVFSDFGYTKGWGTR
jgi:cellulose synthase/poly-beta-1,6-N-acetylglucosamine synthase-like glycosyltransferase